jgi:hypothetical protein
VYESNFSAQFWVNGIRGKNGEREKGGNPLLGADLGRWHTKKKIVKKETKKVENFFSARILVNGTRKKEKEKR